MDKTPASEETKEAMKKFIDADRKMRKQAKKPSGCLVSFAKFTLVVAVLVAIVYGVYRWHPWSYRSSTVEHTALTSCGGKRGYETATTLVVLGIDVRQTKSTICID